MTTFTQSQLDTMARDADTAAKRVLGDSTLADVCVHVKALAAEVERLKNAIEAAERISDGEDVEFQQPHPRILSIVAGGRATMASQQAEIDRLKADNERLNEEAETLVGSEAMALSRVLYSAEKRHVAAEIATAWWKQRDVLRVEVERLQILERQFQLTADGVRVAVGYTVYVIFDGEILARRIMPDGRNPLHWLVDMENGIGWDVSMSYSTREAAEKARQVP